jgi:hypothetical protein
MLLLASEGRNIIWYISTSTEPFIHRARESGMVLANQQQKQH